MAANLKKKEQAELGARIIYRRLMALKADKKLDLSNNQWTKKAGVSTSFFTNMQGLNKAASEPGVGKLRAVLEVVGSNLAEFFLEEGQGRLVQAPTPQALEQALTDALGEGFPRNKAERVAYLASTVRELLGLPESQPATQGSADEIGPADRAAASPAGRATRRA